ncbi:MAG: TIGR00730 family Rossman fold protein [Bryobacteraceae bacterium]|nr:TIGR00730 family Rossman fold protein [Bryobacteraceae bacterium]
MLTSMCVFCGSSVGSRPEYAAAAVTLGQLLANSGIRLVYGGANRGLMGVLADACLEAGGAVTGVMPRFLFEKEIAHRGLTDLRVVETMHERKALMADLASAFVALPGGFAWPEHRNLIVSSVDAADLLDKLNSFQVPALSKWVDPRPGDRR